jgi:hypothetical protein
MALEFQKVVEQAYCELIVAHREHSEIARSVAELGVSGPTPRETLHEVARFAVRCHPVRGFDQRYSLRFKLRALSFDLLPSPRIAPKPTR